MKFLKALGTAALVGIFCASTALSFECTGDSECIFEIDGGTPQTCIEAIEVITGPLTGTGTVKIALVDYKSLAGTCFTLKTNRKGINKITQTKTSAGYRFQYSSEQVEATVPGVTGTFTNLNDLVLISLNTYPNELGRNGGVPIKYRLTKDVKLRNGQHSLTVRAGSTVKMVTK